jgi:hypothetical protein
MVSLTRRRERRASQLKKKARTLAANAKTVQMALCVWANAGGDDRQTLLFSRQLRTQKVCKAQFVKVCKAQFVTGSY